MVKIKKLDSMKKYIYKSVILVLSLGVLAACESDPVMFDSSKSFVAFEKKTAEVKEGPSEDIVQIPVTIAAVPGSPSVTVNFEVLTEGATAIEGEDFEIVNETNTLTCDEGFGTEYIEVKPIDNSDFTGDKTFTIELTGNSRNYPLGAVSTVAVTVVDDEHPLATWLGSYSVNAVSYWSPGTYDESWNVTTKPNPDDVSTLLIEGIGNGDKAIVAKFDTEEMTITIDAGSNIGDAYGYGDVFPQIRK
ncbi:MAG: phospholipid/cholesterol/gamma-HCH transport system substrate-binding protein [Anaerophaga sp.]|nr:phospholipid/cholesterol/gamma-HCH transport system substrate-binding protein [Anaerophaga sp.]